MGILATVTYKKLVLYYYELHCCYVSKTEVCLLCDSILQQRTLLSQHRDFTWNYTLALNGKQYTGSQCREEADIIMYKCSGYRRPFDNAYWAWSDTQNAALKVGYLYGQQTAGGTDVSGWYDLSYADQHGMRSPPQSICFIDVIL